MAGDVTVKFDADTQAYEIGQQRMLRSNAANLRSLQEIDRAQERMRALQAQQGSEFAAIERSNALALQRRRDLISDVGSAMMLVGAIGVAAWGYAVHEAAAFDKQMSAVYASTMASAGAQQELRAAAIRAGADTVFSAMEAAQAEDELAKAGVSVTDIINGGLDGALSLAAAGNLDVASAAEFAATAMSQFHLTGRATAHVADLYAAAAGKAQGSVQDLAGAMKYVGPVANGLGVDIEQTAGTLALFASNGIIGEQAGTSLRGMLSALTSPSVAAKNTMDDLGISVFDAQGNFIGLDGVAGQLQTRMSGLTQEERAAALGRIFGNEQLTAANVLYQEGAAGVDEWTAAVDDSGYASEQASKKTDNLSGDLERLGGSLSSALIDGGSGATSVLRFLTQTADSAVGAFTDLPDPLEATAFGLAGIVGAGTAAVGAVATIGTNIGEFRDRLEEVGPLGETFSGVLGKLGKAAGVASVVAGAAIAIWELGSAAIDAAVDFWDLDGGLSDVQDALAEIDISQFTDDVKGLANSGQLVGDLAKDFGDVDGAVRAIHRSLYEANTGDVDMIAQVQGLDEAFSQLVDNGQVDVALDAFNQLATSAARQNINLSALAEGMPGFTSKLSDYVLTNTEAADAQDGNSAAADDVADAYDQAAMSVDDLKDSLDALNGITRNQYDAEAAWTESLAGLRDKFEEGTDALDRNTESGAANWDLISRSAKSADDLATSIYATTGSYDQFSGSLTASREQLVATLTNMGVSEEAAWQLTDAVLRIPTVAETASNMDHSNFDAGNASVTGAVATLQQLGVTVPVKAEASSFWSTMASITNGTYTATVNTQVGTRSQSSLLGSLYNVPGNAVGGLITGPGTGTSDDVLRWLSNGEFVVPAARVEEIGLANLTALQQGRYADFAMAGFSVPATTTNNTTSTSVTRQTTNHWTVQTGPGPRAVAAAIASRQATEEWLAGEHG